MLFWMTRICYYGPAMVAAAPLPLTQCHWGPVPTGSAAVTWSGSVATVAAIMVPVLDLGPAGNNHLNGLLSDAVFKLHLWDRHFSMIGIVTVQGCLRLVRASACCDCLWYLSTVKKCLSTVKNPFNYKNPFNCSSLSTVKKWWSSVSLTPSSFN